MQEYIMENKGNIWAYLADIYYQEAKSVMISGKENAFVPDEHETETIRYKVFSKGKELAQKIIKNITSNDSKDKAKNLGWLFKPKNSFDAKKIPRPIDDEFNNFLEMLGENTEEDKSKIKWYFLAGFASEYNSLVLAKSKENEGQKLGAFSERPYDAGIIYDMMQFLGVENDNDFYYLAAICERLDVNGYANANVLNSETIIKDIKKHVENNKNELKLSDVLRILLCLNPIIESEEFDKCIFELLKGDIIKNKSITKEDLRQLVITKAYILNHKCYKNKDFQVDGKNIGAKAMDHAENALAFNDIMFNKDLSGFIMDNLTLKENEKLDLTLFATITNSSYFEEKQNELFDKYKPMISYDPAEILVLKGLNIDISADRKINLIIKMIDFMANKDKEKNKDEENKDGEKFTMSAKSMYEILKSLELDKLEKDLKEQGKQGLSEEQKLALIDHVETDSGWYADELVSVLKLDSDKQKMHFLSKLKENNASIRSLADIAEIFSPITSNEMKMEFIKKMEIYTADSYSYDCVGNYEELAKALELEGEQIDAFLSKFTNFESYSYESYNKSIIRMVKALPKATEKQKMAILDLKDKYKTNKLSLYEIVDVIKEFNFKEKEGKKKILEMLTPYSYDKSFDEGNILEIAKALNLNPDDKNDDDLKWLLLKKLAQQIKMCGNDFQKGQIDAYEALKISKDLKLSDEQKKYLCSKQDDAGGHTIVNFNLTPKKLFSADELTKEFNCYLDKNGKSVAEDAKNAAKKKIDDEIKNLKDKDTCDTDKMAEIINVIDDKKEIPKVIEKLMFKKNGLKKSENLKKIDNLEKFAEVANGQKFKEIVKDDKDIKETVFKAVSKSIGNKNDVTSALKFINLKEVEENKELKEAIEKNGGLKNIKDIKVPIDIKLNCDTARQVQKGQKIKITANVRILDGNEKPKGKIKFDLSKIGDSNETEFELKKIGDNIYSAEIECEVKKDGANSVSAEYIPAGGEYYVNGKCKNLEFDTGRICINTSIIEDKYTFGSYNIFTNVGDEKDLIVFAPNIGLAKGKIVVYKCEDEKFDNKENVTEIASFDINKDTASRDYLNFKYQSKEMKGCRLRAEFIPDPEENKYVNGKNVSVSVKTLKRSLSLKVVCDDQELESNNGIKINYGEKKKFKVYLDGYSEDLALRGNLEFYQSEYEYTNYEKIKVLSPDVLGDIKKDENGKYFIETEIEFKKSNESYFKVKYDGSQNDFYDNDSSTPFSLEQTFKGKITGFDIDCEKEDDYVVVRSEDEIKIRVYVNVEDKTVKPNGKIEISYEDTNCIQGGKFESEVNFDDKTGRYYADLILTPKFIGDPKNLSFFGVNTNLKYIPGDPDDYEEKMLFGDDLMLWVDVPEFSKSHDMKDKNQEQKQDQEESQNSSEKKDDNSDKSEIKDVEVIILGEENNNEADITPESNKKIKLRVYLDVDDQTKHPHGEIEVVFDKYFLANEKSTGRIYFDTEKNKYCADIIIDSDFKFNEDNIKKIDNQILITSPVINYVPHNKFGFYKKASFENKFSIALDISKEGNKTVVSKAKVITGVVFVGAAITLSGMSTPIAGILCVGLLTGKIICGVVAFGFGGISSVLLVNARRSPLKLKQNGNSKIKVARDKIKSHRDNTGQKNNKSEHEKE